MKMASVTEAKNRLSALLAEVRAGEIVVIVDRGTPVARMEGMAALVQDDDGRLARLRRAGVVQPARSVLPEELMLDAPPTTSGGRSISRALIDERRGDRAR